VQIVCELKRRKDFEHKHFALKIWQGSQVLLSKARYT